MIGLRARLIESGVSPCLRIRVIPALGDGAAGRISAPVHRPDCERPPRPDRTHAPAQTQQPGSAERRRRRDDRILQEQSSRRARS
jgi:hypothetical protein